MMPVIHYPFDWFETFFHELSHGISALATGGSIHRIELNVNGSGVCTTSGGSQFLILFSGYAGSSLWGTLIYLSAAVRKNRLTRSLALIFIAVNVLVLVLWSKDVTTMLILAVMSSLFLLSFSVRNTIFRHYVIYFIAIYVVLNSIRSPLDLFDGRAIGDGAALSNITMLPELFWIAIWYSIAILCLFFMYKISNSNSK
jgi:phosphoglycerol transferase MdoB-like AlkP superfamily enzyme